MTRYALPAFALAALVCARADGQQQDVFYAVEANVAKGKLHWQETISLTVEKEVAVEKEVNGKKVIVTQKVPVTEYGTEKRSMDLKDLKVTDAAGKVIPAEKVAEMLKEPTMVVIVESKISAKGRKLFKDTTLFIEGVPDLFSPADAPPKVAPPPPAPKLPPAKP